MFSFGLEVLLQLGLVLWSMVSFQFPVSSLLFLFLKASSVRLCCDCVSSSSLVTVECSCGKSLLILIKKFTPLLYFSLILCNKVVLMVALCCSVASLFAVVAYDSCILLYY